MKHEEATPLYEQEITGPFAALCGGGTDNDGNMESCLTLAELAGGDFAMRGNKPEDEAAGGEIRVSPAEIRAFAQGVMADPRFNV